MLVSLKHLCIRHMIIFKIACVEKDRKSPFIPACKNEDCEGCACALFCNTKKVCMKKTEQVATFVEICFELIGFKKLFVKYFACGICFHTVLFNELAAVCHVNLL